MQSCRFFLPTFHENFKFLKNCPYDFHKIFHSHSTPKRALACAKASKSYDWNVRNIAKKWPKNGHFSIYFFRFSQKLYIRFERNFYSPSTLYYGLLCAISSNSYGWDVRNIAKFNPKMAKKTSQFSTFFDFPKNCPYDSNEIFTVLLHYIMDFVCNFIKFAWLGCGKHSQI